MQSTLSGGIDPAVVPQSLKQPCDPVSDLPEGSLSGGVTSTLWGKDRAALGTCRRRHAGLVKAIEAIEGQGGGVK